MLDKKTIEYFIKKQDMHPVQKKYILNEVSNIEWDKIKPSAYEAIVDDSLFVPYSVFTRNMRKVWTIYKQVSSWRRYDWNASRVKIEWECSINMKEHIIVWWKWFKLVKV